MTDTVEPIDRINQLREFLDIDPANETLRMDLAESALQTGRPDIALETLENWQGEQTSRAARLALTGLCNMKLNSHEIAADCFEQVLTDEPDNTAMKFNLAWSRAMMGNKQTAIDLLDLQTTSDLPQAAMLRVQLIHESGDLMRAWQMTEHHLTQHPNDPGLNAAVSVLALDLEKTEMAASCAERSNGHPDALSTLGTLALDADNASEAASLFSSAVKANQTRPRAWIGLGLSELANGQYAAATEKIDYGASLFQTHIGSWIAAGWAHLLNGDRVAARERFETALALDRNFAESHGSLAVIEAMEDNQKAAKDLSKRALKLDKNCFSAAFATTLMLSAQGKDRKAQKIFDRAINTPIAENGKTIAQSLRLLGLN